MLTQQTSFRRPAVRAVAAAGVAAAAALSFSPPARADTASLPLPALDRWMYPFDGTGSGGARGTASTFGAVGNAGFDNRDAQFVIGFNTGSVVPTGRGATNYVVTSAKLTIVDSQGTYTYDDTYDSIASYAANAPDDPGRPLELYGVGFRNGFGRLGLTAADADPAAFKEATNFSPVAQPAERTRSAYAMGFDGAGVGRDVSNNIADGFESNPWAIGKATTITAGATVPSGTTFTFGLNLADPFVRAYVQNALNAGSLGLTVSSLTGASQMDAGGIPQFYNKENAVQQFIQVAPQLEVQYTIVPEPSAAAALGAAAAAGLLARRRRSRRKLD